MLSIPIVGSSANKAVILLQIKHELLRDYCSFASVRKEKKPDVFKILFEVDNPESIDIQSSSFKIKGH